jgi:hypothetical protein
LALLKVEIGRDVGQKPRDSRYQLLSCCCSVSVRAGTGKCSPDSVAVGPVCVDKYDASIWKLPPTTPSLVKKAQAGKATLEDLMRAGATQLGCAGPPVWRHPIPRELPRRRELDRAGLRRLHSRCAADHVRVVVPS